MARLHLAPSDMNLERYLAIHSPMAGLLDEVLLSKEFHAQLKDNLELPVALSAGFSGGRRSSNYSISTSRFGCQNSSIMLWIEPRWHLESKSVYHFWITPWWSLCLKFHLG